MASKKKAAPPPEPPRETEENPYGTPANAVHRTNCGPHRVLSARVGYFIQQHQILREHIEGLEDDLLKAQNELKVEKNKKALKQDQATDQKDYGRLKTLYDNDMKRYDSLSKQYDELEKQYDKAVEICHENDLDCGDEECEVCQEAREAQAEAAEEAKIQDGGSRPTGIREQYEAAAEERREHDRAR
jgi:hypothetical protein